jgi:hypothetical protein
MTGTWRRRSLFLAAALVVVPTVTVPVIGTSASRDDVRQPVAMGARGGAAGPAPKPATARPSVAVRRAPAVRMGKPAALLPAVSVAVGTVKAVTVTAHGPGEIAGPAVAVTVTVRNGGSVPFSLGGTVVTATYDGTVPGDSTSAPPSHELAGMLAPGRTASGTYVFRVPAKGISSLLVEVSSDASPTILQFRR